MNRSPELKEPILYLILYPWNKATSIKKEKQSKIRLDLSPISQILSRDVASPPNLLLALALYHGLSTSCHLNIPSVSSKVEKDAHLLRKGETDKHRLDGDLENNSSSSKLQYLPNHDSIALQFPHTSHTNTLLPKRYQRVISLDGTGTRSPRTL